MKVIWTNFALESLREIYCYYKDNVGNTVASKIRKDVFSATKQLKIHPNSGTKEALLESVNEGHRYLLVGNYKIIYKSTNSIIYITDVFDMRRNPVKLITNNSDNFTLNELNPEYSIRT